MIFLKDIVKIEKGRKYNLLEENQQGAIRVFQANDFRNEKKPLYTLDDDGVLAMEDDIMLIWDGSVGQMGFGRSGYVGSTMVKLKVKNKKLFSPFFIYKFLQTKSEYLKRKSTGATIMHINRKSLEQLEIPDIDINDQIHIAKLLCKAETLIEQRKQSIALLDEFLKSSFANMFGNPVANPKQFKKEKLKEFIAFLTSGGRGWNKYYSEKGKRFIRSFDVQMNSISNEDAVYVTPPNNQEAKRTEVKPNDVLLTVTGSKIGRVTTVPKDFGIGYVSQHVAIIRVKNILPLYLSYYLSDVNCGQYLIGRNQYGQTKPGLNFNQIESFEILNPPVELQTEFSNIVSKVEALKEQYKNSLQELENLYGSLSQKAFRGELISSTVRQLAIPENKKGFAKQVLGGKIVSLFKDDKNFTHIKFQKLQYLAEHIAEEDLLWNYYRQAAGPYDNKFMHNVANKLKQNKWFEERKYKFYPLQKANDIDRYYQNYFGSKQDKLSELFGLLKNATEKFCEAVSTIYAVWNNHIILNQSFDKSKIKTDFFEWSSRKENMFTEVEFEKALAWMQKHTIIPNGFGQLIKEKTSK